LTRKGCFFAVLAAAIIVSGAAIVPAATQDKPIAKPATAPASAQPAPKKPAAKKAAAKKQDAGKPDSKKDSAAKSSAKSAPKKDANKKDAKKDIAEAAKPAPAKAAAKKADVKKATARKSDTKKAAAKKDPARAADRGAVPLPKMRPADGVPIAVAAFPTPIGVPPSGVLSPDLRGSVPAAAPALASVNPQQQIPVVLAPAEAPSPDNLAAVKKAIDLARRGRGNEATAIANAVTDPVAAKLIEWMVLRSENGDFDFQRYAGFAAANPGWPNITQFRRKAEAALWQNGVNDTVVRRYFATTKPLTAKGKLALARAVIDQGDRATAQQLVRDVWRTDALTADMEKQVLDSFGPLLTGGDHKARMDRRLYAEDAAAALRAAQKLGPAQVAIVKAAEAVMDKSSRAKALLDAVPAEVRNDTVYLFNRAQWLRRNEKFEEAARTMLSAPVTPAAVQDPDEWWSERRLLARKLLDLGDAQTAFRIARDAAPPEKEGARVEQLFTAGWIAFRFLNDPAQAKPLFARCAQVAEHPASFSRAHYWQARTAEALGQNGEARSLYERAARASTTYYGQMAHARIGGAELRLPPPPAPHPQGTRLEVVRAMDMLYAIDERDLVASATADLADRAIDPAALAAVAALAERKGDARTLALLGRTAVGRGLPFEYYAYPIAGLPRVKPIGAQDVEPHVAYAIARQESGFNPRAISSAKAQGLMQVMPATAKLVAKKNGVAFDPKRLLEPVYNVQIGSAELGDVLDAYRGSYILAFVAYNAGRGRVREWIERFGDPRDPKVDPVDWVERIPFSETRNYVQRVMENMQVYRVRFGASQKLMIEADLRRGMAAN
jgi:soluble lytic murein transglycosylase